MNELKRYTWPSLIALGMGLIAWNQWSNHSSSSQTGQIQQIESMASVNHNSAAPKIGLLPIQEIRVGMRVPAHNPEISDEERANWVEPEQATWRLLKLEMLKSDGSLLAITMIRPHEWVTANDAEVGKSIFLDIFELGAVGNAHVLEIGPCPTIAPGPGSIVTSTFAHAASNTILDVRFSGSSETIGVTENHPFWSVDRQEFIEIGLMKIGERVQTHQGETERIESKVARAEPEKVFNFEVFGEHVYYTGHAKLLVHNAYPLTPVQQELVDSVERLKKMRQIMARMEAIHQRAIDRNLPVTEHLVRIAIYNQAKRIEAEEAWFEFLLWGLP